MKNLPVFLIALIIALSAPGIKAAQAKTMTILAFGDSLTAGLGLPMNQAFPAQLEARLLQDGYDVKVINSGVSGESTSGAATRTEWTLTQNAPDFVILETAGNDMLRAIPPDVTRANIDKILGTIAAHNIPVLLTGMRAFGNLGQRFNEQYEKMFPELAEKYHAVYYPFFLEGVALHPEFLQLGGVHPNADGVAVIVNNMLPSVKKLLKEK